MKVDSVNMARIEQLKEIAADYAEALFENQPFDFSQFGLTPKEIEYVKQAKDSHIRVTEVASEFDKALEQGEEESFDPYSYGLTDEEIEELKEAIRVTLKIETIFEGATSRPQDRKAWFRNITVAYCKALLEGNVPEFFQTSQCNLTPDEVEYLKDIEKIDAEYIVDYETNPDFRRHMVELREEGQREKLRG